MIVRLAVHSDLPLLVEFQLAMAFETERLQLDADVCRSGVMAVLDNANLGRYWICEVDGRPGACLLQTFEWSDWRNGMVWWIHSLYVEPRCRQRGVFRLMYEHLRGLVRENSQLRGLRLYVDSTNSLALEVYRRIGMNADHYRVCEWMKST